jgi:hypothetical protein
MPVSTRILAANRRFPAIGRFDWPMGAYMPLSRAAVSRFALRGQKARRMGAARRLPGAQAIQTSLRKVVT